MTDILPPPERPSAEGFRRFFPASRWGVGRILSWALLSLVTAIVVGGAIIMAIDAILLTIQISAR